MQTDGHICSHRQRGTTLILVALAMVAILAMAALSIDVVVLYLARSEAQRAADAGALAAARVISISGVTGDPTNSSGYWPTACTQATQVATSVANQNLVASTAASSVNVTFLYNGATTDCSSPSGGFAVNPQVQVQVLRGSIPTFFARIWRRGANSVSASATAEAYNPSGSDGLLAKVAPVQPRCVKPWIVPNLDPQNPNITCTNNATCARFVDLGSGQIIHGGISTGGGDANGVIGETFWLSPDCVHNSSPCSLRRNPPEANYYPNQSGLYEQPPSLQYLPAQTLYASTAVPSCSASGSLYENAIEGCDQSTVYQCGVQNMNTVDLSENPGEATNDTMNGVQCLTHQSDATNITSSSGQDYLAGTSFAAPTSYPFQILAGTDSPLVTLASSPLASGTPITSSNSIVSLPIYDQTAGGGTGIHRTGTTDITIVGFLQVFINAVDQAGNVNVTVLNVAGCTNGGPAVGAVVTGSSPVPVRLITPQ